MPLNQNQIKNLYFATIQDAETRGRLEDICYVKETNSFYRIDDLPSGYIEPDDYFVLDSGLANKYWVKITTVTGFENSFNNMFYIIDQRANGISGGSFVAGDWRTRTLNTVMINDINGASLSNNQITLPSGIYFFECFSPALMVDENKALLYNVTDNENTIIGTSEYSPNSQGRVNNTSNIIGRFTITNTKIFEVRHRCNRSNTTDGFGRQSGLDVPEIYTTCKIWKIGEV